MPIELSMVSVTRRTGSPPSCCGWCAALGPLLLRPLAASAAGGMSTVACCCPPSASPAMVLLLHHQSSKPTSTRHAREARASAHVSAAAAAAAAPATLPSHAQTPRGCLQPSRLRHSPARHFRFTPQPPAHPLSLRAALERNPPLQCTRQRHPGVRPAAARCPSALQTRGSVRARLCAYARCVCAREWVCVYAACDAGHRRSRHPSDVGRASPRQERGDPRQSASWVRPRRDGARVRAMRQLGHRACRCCCGCVAAAPRAGLFCWVAR